MSSMNDDFLSWKAYAAKIERYETHRFKEDTKLRSLHNHVLS